MARPRFPNCAMPASVIRGIREKQEAYDRDPEGYDKHEKEWSLDECRKRGCLPTGESIECLYGQGEWSE